MKTNRQLRTKSNVSLACLATTDLVVGLVVQPFEIVHYSFMLKGETDIICSTLAKVRTAFTIKCVITSLNLFVLLSAERYIAIKHPFTYENLVTEVRIIAATGLTWAVVIAIPAEDFWPPNIQYVGILLVVISMQLISIALVVYLNVSVYREIRRRRSYSRIRRLFTAQLLYCSQFPCVISRQTSLLPLWYRFWKTASLLM